MAIPLPRLSEEEARALERRHARSRADQRYIEEHYDELFAKYPERLVAVLDQQVIAVADDLEELAALVEAKGIPIALPRVEFIADPEEELIVPAMDR